VRKLVTIGVCAIILGTTCACTQCQTPPGTGIRAGSNSVGFGNRAGAPNYYCQPGVCKRTGWNDPDYRVCPGGFGSKTAAAPAAKSSTSEGHPGPWAGFPLMWDTSARSI
jgi:hypothetical protein